MRVLYGVVGDGMGHATRSRVVIDHLLARGHQVKVVVSGRAFDFLRDAVAGNRSIEVIQIHGLHFVYRGRGVDRSETLRVALAEAPAGLRKNLQVWRRMVATFAPDVVFSDFESWAYLFGRRRRVPVISVDNQQVFDRCSHPAEVTDGDSAGFRMTRAAIRLRLPRAWHYVITSFFFPPVRKPRTTLVPPILRPEILAARREPGSHVLVYQTASTDDALVPLLRRLPREFRVYGMGRDQDLGNVRLRSFSQTGFVDDLRTARAVIAGGGFSLMGEAVHLRVPMLSFPLEGQWEQQLNARWLQHLGYGARAERLDEATVARFLGGVDSYAAALQRYVPRDNSLLHACVDELLARIDAESVDRR